MQPLRESFVMAFECESEISNVSRLILVVTYCNHIRMCAMLSLYGLTQYYALYIANIGIDIAL